nr:hypothetical protein [bacterium]
MKGLRLYFKTVNLNKFLLFWQVLFSIIAHLSLASVIIPIANIISSVSVASYNNAKGLVLIGLLLVLIYVLFMLSSQIISNKIQSTASNALETKLLEKVFNLSQGSSMKIDKQKLIEVISSDNSIISSFPQKIANFCGIFTELVLFLTIIGYSNLSLLAIVICVTIFISLVNWGLSLIENHFNNKSEEQRYQKKKLISETINGANLSASLNLTDSLFIKNQEQNQLFSHSVAKNNTVSLLKKLITYFIWALLFSIMIIYMVNLVKTDYLTLSLFVLLIPYVYNVLNKSLECFNFSSEVNSLVSACKRANYILSLTGQSDLVFGDNNNDLLYGDLLFSSVSYNYQFAKISNISARFAKKSLNCCIFNKTETKNLFIKLLSRKIKPLTGT